MNGLRIWGLFLLLLTGCAMAGQGVGQYFVGDQWNGSNEGSLPHYRSPGEGCVGVLREHMRSDQAQNPANPYRYNLFAVSQDDGSFFFGCGAEIDEYTEGQWLQVELFEQDTDSVYGFSQAMDCTLAALLDPDNNQCGPPKCCVTPLGNPIDAGTGNKRQVETDYDGAGAFPLHFERTYQSGRTWLNNSVPIGIGWTHTYLASVFFMPAPGSGTDTLALAYRPDGVILRFTLTNGVWTPDADVAERLSATFDSNGIPSATLVNTDDSVEQYDGLGRLTSITNRDGLTQTLSYVTASGGYANDVQQVTDPQGHTLTFGYNPNGQLASLTDGIGKVIQYNYDTNGNLSTVIYPDLGTTTKTRTYSYNEAAQMAASWPNALTGIVDENNQRYASWGYDSDGRATSSVHGIFASGGIDKTTLTFNANGTTSFKDALGQTRSYGFDVLYEVAHPASLSTVCSACSANDQTHNYDSNGYSSAKTDFDGNQSSYVFTAALDGNGHPRGLETQRVEGIPPKGSTNTSAERTINTRWDPNFRVPDQRTVTDSSKTTESLTNWIYNLRGQATFRCDVDPSNSSVASYICGSSTSAPVGVRQWAWTYCNAISSTCPLIGLMLTSADPLKHVTSYAYYGTSASTCATAPTTCPHRLGDVMTVSNAKRQITTYPTYDGDGRVLSMTDANGVETDRTYHPRGWLTQSAVRGTNNAVTTDDAITGYTYDGVGQVLRATQPDASYIAFTYDNAHRLINIEDNLKNAIHYKLDNAGDHLEDDTEMIVGTTTTIYRKVQSVYNALGQLKTSENAASTPTVPVINASYTYDANGNRLLTTDGVTPDGRAHVTADSWDPLNRLSKLWQDKCTASSGCTGSVNAITDYSYDARDNLTTVEDPQTLNTIYQYDGLNNQSELTSPDTGVTTSKYDAAGNLHTRTDARGVVATYSYDVLNRLTGIAYSPVTTPSVNVLFGYDTVETGCPSTATFAQGHLTHFQDVSSGASTTKLCYDRFGNMVYKAQATSGVTFATSGAYDFAHHLKQITTPQGTLIAYTRDSTGRITGVTSTLKGKTATTVVEGVTYDPFGPVTSITYGANQRVVSRTYDQDYVVQGVVDSTAGKTDGIDLVFGRDVLGNLTQLALGSGASAPGNLIAYDGLNRLSAVTNSLNSALIASYTYDGTGNRTGKQVGSTDQTYAYPLTSHHLAGITTTSATPATVVERGYDKDGNTTGIGTATPTTEQTFFYDNTGRMTQFGVGTATRMQYLFNALGQRVEKLPTGNTAGNQFTVYDESGHVLGDYNDTTAIVPVREMIWMDDLPVGVLNGSTGTLAYIEPDQIGTPRIAVDATSNAAVWSWSPLNDPFGETQPMPTSTITLNNRFPGQIWDAESGLNYNYFRDYDSGTGRYLESDPLGLQGGISTYTYARSTPFMATDFLGLKAQVCCRKIPWLPAAHCFINEEQNRSAAVCKDGHCGSQTRRVGLQGPSPWGSSSFKDAGQIHTNDPFDQPSQARCGDWNQDCGVSACIDNAIKTYANPSVYNAVHGPNSNTFAATVAGACGISAPWTPWPTPGWSSPRAASK
jgi:RHS repeat-associated protein